MTAGPSSSPGANRTSWRTFPALHLISVILMSGVTFDACAAPVPTTATA